MKKKIAVVTGSRSEYGILYWILKKISESSTLELQLIVTGMHLSKKYGETWKDIEKDGFEINDKIYMNMENSERKYISESIGAGIIGFSKSFEKLKPDILLILGDRYEILAAAVAAIPYVIPIAHIAGGEITEGAFDEQIRHALTKISHIHFPGANKYAENIKNMGEESWRIFNVGDTSIEVIKKMKFYSKNEIFKEFSVDKNKKIILCTLHPVSLNNIKIEKKEVDIFFDVLSEFENENIIITYPNSDPNSDIIIEKIKLLNNKINIKVYENLGIQKYLSVLKYCDLIIGNSSSGIVEGPIFKKPVINYGDRQKGRLKALNILDVKAANPEELRFAIKKSLYNKEYIKYLECTKSLYGEGNSSDKIVEVLENLEINKKLLRKKFV